MVEAQIQVFGLHIPSLSLRIPQNPAVARSDPMIRDPMIPAPEPPSPDPLHEQGPNPRSLYLTPGPRHVAGAPVPRPLLPGGNPERRY